MTEYVRESIRKCPERRDANDRKNRAGVILLITLVILVILATLGYTVTARVTARRHRDQYIIDYGQARYACASAMKYAMASVRDLQPQLVSRPNEPDFSDVFAMSELEYQEFLVQSAKKLAQTDRGLTDDETRKDRDAQTEWDADAKTRQNKKTKTKQEGSEEKRQGTKAKTKRATTRRDADGVEDANDIEDVNDMGTLGSESLVVPGPYGPPWPLVVEPLECEIGSAKVTIEIEDENAKYPLNWALIADEQWKATADTGFVTFCDWMGYTESDIETLRADLAKIGEIRPYQIEFKPQTQAKAAEPPASLRSRVSRASTSTASARRAVTKNTAPVVDQAEQQKADYVKLLHSSLIDADFLSRPSIASDTRNESAMKYLGLWAARQVNVNTAPRHVLEAALAFGSIADAPKIAEEIIRQRQVKPFSSIDEVKKGVFQYSDSIEKCKDFLTTASSVFTIRITAVSGVAKATVIAAVSKEGDKIKQMGIISD
jgi:hypothetical protein